MTRFVRERLPSYVRQLKGAGGKPTFYWELPPWARPGKDPATGKIAPAMRHGVPCPVRSEALGGDRAAMREKAEALNEALAGWRKGVSARKVAKGSIAWLFAWYREQDRFTKNAAKTRADYTKLMHMLVDLETKPGAPRLGVRMANRVDATAADMLYKLLLPRGARQAGYAMQVCRLVWSWAVRHKGATGITENPFKGMGLKSTAAKGNRATTRAEYDLYRATARELGFQSMATAAALAFEGCQRAWDVFGYEDPDGVKHRGFRWQDYRPGDTISLVQSKTGNLVELPLTIDVAGERAQLYPDLEKELARSRAAAAASAEVIVVEERSGARYKERRMSSVHRAICEKAGLPKAMTFTGFRHGGITEVGAVTADVRPISGHATLDVTRIYNKTTQDKARQIAAARREHIGLLGADSERDSAT